MIVYALEMTDGSIAIMQIVPKTVASNIPAVIADDGRVLSPARVQIDIVYASVDACLAKWPPADRAKVVRHQQIDIDTLPQDRTFRNALTMQDGAVKIDMGRAREVARTKIRGARQSLLEALDIAAIRAAEDGDDAGKAEVIRRKQVLRDAPGDPRIATAMTVDELREAVPAIIKEWTSP